MSDTELLDLSIDYMVSLKDTSYSDGLTAEQLRDKAEQELNSMTRCEFLRIFGDPYAMKDFHERQKLERGETITKEYRVEIKEDEPSRDSGVNNG